MSNCSNRLVYFAQVIFLVLASCGKENLNPVLPLAPSSLTATLTSPTQIALAWTDNSTNEIGFKIERKSDDSQFLLVGTVGENVTAYTDGTISAGGSYSYRVYAYSLDGNSISYSNVVVISTPFEPIIDGLMPRSCVVGSMISIRGKHFSSVPADNFVSLNGIAMPIISASTDELVVEVPTNSTTGQIQVTVNSLSAISDEELIVLKVTTSTLAGGVGGYFDGAITDALFYSPRGVAVDFNGNTYVADASNSKIRKISPSGVVTTLAGSSQGYADGLGALAKFDQPWDLVVDKDGNIYVSDAGNHRIRRITPSGDVSTLAGGSYGFSDGQGALAKFAWPRGIAIDASGNLYVCDQENFKIRKINQLGLVTTVGGSSQGFLDGHVSVALFSSIWDLDLDQAGNIFISDDNRIRRLSSDGMVTTLAGGSAGFIDSNGTNSKFDGPIGVAVNLDGNIFVCDYSNRKIRMVDPLGYVITIALGPFGDTGPYCITMVDASTMYVTENHRIRKIEIQ